MFVLLEQNTNNNLQQTKEVAPLSIPAAVKKERKYIKVTSDFDATGYMQPRSITWDDGRIFRIEQVKDYRPAGVLGVSYTCDCYTVIIGGKPKHLFFERTDPLFHSLVGRWFVECLATDG